MGRTAIAWFILGSCVSISLGQTSSMPKTKPKEVTEVLGKDIDHWVGEMRIQGPEPAWSSDPKHAAQFGADHWPKALPVVLAELKKHSATTPVDVSVRLHGTKRRSGFIWPRKILIRKC